ncbi:MAG: leucine-rich repeat domain-containing protein, partial [Cyanobacteria bacterium P01_F01_bin.53]
MGSLPYLVMLEPMAPPNPAELDLINQLGALLGRPLEKITEARFEQHGQALSVLGNEKQREKQRRIIRDAYSLAKDGSISGLFLQPVTSHILLDFPLQELTHLRYLYLYSVRLRSYSFLSTLTGLTSLDLGENNISDCSFLSTLTGLTSLELGSNNISDCSFLSTLTGLTSLDLGS